MVGPAESSSIVAKVATSEINFRAACLRSSVRSTTATIFASPDCSYAGQCPFAATAPKPMIAPRRTSLLCFESFEDRVDDREGGIRLVRGEDERRMNTDARRVTHHDQPLRQATLEEFDAAFLRQQRFRFRVRDEIETDEQSFSTDVRERAVLFRQPFKTFAQ